MSVIKLTWTDEECRRAGRDVELALRTLENYESEGTTDRTVIWCVLAVPSNGARGASYTAELRPDRKRA